MPPLLREHGHSVHVVDQYAGRTFDDYEAATAYADSLGYPRAHATSTGRDGRA